MRILIILLAGLIPLSYSDNKAMEKVEKAWDIPEGMADATLKEASAEPGFLKNLPEDMRKGADFLIGHMPPSDMDTLMVSGFYANLDTAYKARELFPWAKTVPEDVFLNDVLPYAVVDETRENWRPLFLSLFTEKVKECKTMEEAVKAVNATINETVGVEYNTKREKTNQSPAESMKQHMASCTGLAILLVDAFRSVGIPARFAGTASWHDDRGNHSWVEVWVDGKWRITEFYMPAKLDNPWFMANAAKAKPGDRKYAIYATSYKPTGESFPMVWNSKSEQVHGIDVTKRYIDIYESMASKAHKDGTHVFVGLRMFKDREHTASSGDRIAVNVDVFDGVMQVGGGRTSGPRQDMNDILTFLLEKNKTYTFMYHNTAGEKIELKAEVADKPLTLDAYMD